MVVLTATLMLAACLTRTVTVTQEVTRQVEVTVLVTQPSGAKASPMPKSAIYLFA